MAELPLPGGDSSPAPSSYISLLSSVQPVKSLPAGALLEFCRGREWRRSMRRSTDRMRPFTSPARSCTPHTLRFAAMAPSRVTKAKTHVFSNDDLKQVLETSSVGPNFTKTKRESPWTPLQAPGAGRCLAACRSAAVGARPRPARMQPSHPHSMAHWVGRGRPDGRNRGPPGSPTPLAAPLSMTAATAPQWSSPSAPPAAMWMCCASCWRRAPPAHAWTSRCGLGAAAGRRPQRRRARGAAPGARRSIRLGPRQRTPTRKPAAWAAGRSEGSAQQAAAARSRGAGGGVKRSAAGALPASRRFQC